METALAVARELGDVLEYLEDPALGTRPPMAEIAARTRVPLATNMCVTTFAEIREAFTSGAVQVVLSDHHYWGGLRNTRELAAICRAFGVGVSMHSNTHLGISLAAMTHVAATVPDLHHACDTHYPWQDEDVVTERPAFRNGAVAVSDAPGLGVTLDRDRLAALHERWLADDGALRDRDDGAAMRLAHPGWRAPRCPLVRSRRRRADAAARRALWCTLAGSAPCQGAHRDRDRRRGTAPPHIGDGPHHQPHVDPLAPLRAPGDPSCDVYLTGTVFLDIIFTGLASAPVRGTESWARGMGSSPGGVANMAAALARLGLRTSLAAAFGDDHYGEYCWDELEQGEGIDLSISRRVSGWHSPVTVSMAYEGERTMVSHGHEPPPEEPAPACPPRARAAVASLTPGRRAPWIAEAAKQGTASSPTSAGTTPVPGTWRVSPTSNIARRSCRTLRRPCGTPAPNAPAPPRTR